MKFKGKSRNNTLILAKVSLIAHNDTVHYCILIDLVFHSISLILILNMQVPKERNKKTLSLLYSGIRFLKGPKMQKKLHHQDTFPI